MSLMAIVRATLSAVILQVPISRHTIWTVRQELEEATQYPRQTRKISKLSVEMNEEVSEKARDYL